jgi:hypothetical protein
MKQFGSKDVMRMESIKEKSYGNYMTQLTYAFNMATAITEPGKAMSRGYAAQEIFGEHSAVAQVFFERAYDLGGKDVKPAPSVNPFEDIDAEYVNIPLEERPASKKPNPKILDGRTIKRKTPWSNLLSLGKINTINGSGPQINLYDKPNGTIEVWKSETGTYRLIYTSNYESIYFIDEERNFKYEDKIHRWVMADYIESKFISNLAPLYGKSISIYCYD